jgi:hypothetical protein
VAIACITLKPVLTRGKTTPIGTELALEKSVYEKLRRDGAVITVAEHATLTQAKAEADSFTAEAAHSAEEERKREEAAADPPSSGTEEGAPSEPTSEPEAPEPAEPKPRRSRR